VLHGSKLGAATAAHEGADDCPLPAPATRFVRAFDRCPALHRAQRHSKGWLELRFHRPCPDRRGIHGHDLVAKPVPDLSIDRLVSQPGHRGLDGPGGHRDYRRMTADTDEACNESAH